MSRRSANRSAAVLHIEIGSSRFLSAVLVLLHLGALALLYPIDPPWWLGVSLAVLLGASLYRSVTLHAWRNAASAVTALRWSDDAGLELSNADGALRAAIVRSRFVHRWLVLLSTKSTGDRWGRSLAIAADALDPESFRRLRVALLAPPRAPTA